MEEQGNCLGTLNCVINCISETGPVYSKRPHVSIQCLETDSLPLTNGISRWDGMVCCFCSIVHFSLVFPEATPRHNHMKEKWSSEGEGGYCLVPSLDAVLPLSVVGASVACHV